jgi:hypothetical protein
MKHRTAIRHFASTCNWMRNDNIIHDINETARLKRFWLVSFAVYAMAEALFWLINYLITRQHCIPCLQPPVYFIMQWLLTIISTALLWYALNAFYFASRWSLLPVNILLFAVHYFLWIGLQYLIDSSDSPWLINRPPGQRDFNDYIYGSWFDIGKYIPKATAFYILKFYAEYRRSERQRIALAVLNKDMQLNLLKQQLSPHFYFNTLNNLYGLANSNNPKLPDALSQLSNIMRYVIVDCNQSKVLLQQEVNFLQSYIALEKLRYEHNTVIDMQVQGNANGQSILPLLLIQFVENAFKHGMKEKSEHNWMKVNMQINKNDLLFSVDNSYYANDRTEGIGIASVRHRLDLQYEGRYDLQMLHENNRFSVTLKLNLGE